MKTTLLIDGDILAYQAAASVEEKSDWGDGVKSVTVGDPKDAERKLRDSIEHLHDTLGYQTGIVCLSCPTAEGWRAKVLPTYKAHRDPAAKPQLLGHIKAYIRSHYRVKETPTLEADDVMGILSTHPKLIPGEKIIVSSDKDMKTVPGLLYSPYHGGPVQVIDKAQADYWHLYQTLVGDATDGYKGCPGVGPVKAAKILSEAGRAASTDQDALTPWEAVVVAFMRKDLTEDDALVQARVARICRYTDYDFKRKEVKLWQPDSAG